MNIEKILDNYRKEIRCREFGGKHIVALPIFFPSSRESIAIRIEFDEKNRPSISDCHTTLDYLEEMNIKIDDYAEKLGKIMHRYGLKLDEKEFVLIVPTDDEYCLTKYLGFFVQAISLIANIDL